MPKTELDEMTFKADHDESEVAGPVSTGDTKRPADKTQGEKKMTKAGYISDMIKRMGVMSPEELSSAHGKFTSAFKGDAKDNSSKNKATITAKEDIDAIFGDTELTEDFRERTHVLFETAVHARSIIETARIEEEFEAKLDEAVAARLDEVNTAVDDYLSYVAEQWLEDNKLEVEAGIRTEVSESFLDGLQTLFAEHYVNIPESEVEVVEALAAKVEELEDQVNEEVEGRIEVQKELHKRDAEKVIIEAKEGMVDSDAERLDVLIEAIDYSDIEEFARKLTIVKENYFPAGGSKKKPVVQKDQLLSEVIDEDENEKDNVVYEDPQMKHYVEALSRTLKS